MFSTTLDFGAAAFPGAAHWLEISVRAGASTGAYTTLTPRQPVNSTPYAIRALSAETVTGSVPASQLTGTLPPSVLPAGGSYINNSTAQQAASNFNISGDGTAGGTLSGNLVNAATQYNLGGQRVLRTIESNGNLFVGIRSGESNSIGHANSFFGQEAGRTTTTGDNNSFFGRLAGRSNETGQFNSFFGSSTGVGNTSGRYNSFFGSSAGSSNETGEENAYFGYAAGNLSNGFGNSFFGSQAGANAALTSYNSFFGRRAGLNTTKASYNAFFGTEAGVANTNGRNNSFFGAYAGAVNTTGANNTFVGYSAAPLNDTGSYNTFIGYAGGFTNTGGSNNTLIGANANVGVAGLNYATAIGAGAQVLSHNTINLGRSGDRTLLGGDLYFKSSVPGGGSTPLCVSGGWGLVRSATNLYRVDTCSSSQRYKSNIEPLQHGLRLIQRLRPVTFDWKERNEHDLGFIAEEVAEVEPLLTFRNEKGEIEGVKYQLVSAVLVNAVKNNKPKSNS